MLSDDSAGELLNTLQGRDVLFQVWIPDCTTVFKLG